MWACCDQMAIKSNVHWPMWQSFQLLEYSNKHALWLNPMTIICKGLAHSHTEYFLTLRIWRTIQNYPYPIMDYSIHTLFHPCTIPHLVQPRNIPYLLSQDVSLHMVVVDEADLLENLSPSSGSWFLVRWSKLSLVSYWLFDLSQIVF